MLIVEFVVGTHCIITHWQVKPELPDSPQLLHRDATFSIGMPIYAKSTIARLPFGRHAPMLRSDSIFWQLGRWFDQTISCYHFWRVTFIAEGGQNYHLDDSLGLCASIHLTSTLFPPTYDVRWLIDGKFRGLTAKVDDLISI